VITAQPQQSQLAPLSGTAAAVAAVRHANAPWRGCYVRRLRISDSLIVAAVIGIAQTLRFGGLTSGNLAGPAGPTSVDYIVVSTSIAAIWIAVLAIYRTRAAQIIGNGLEEYRRLWTATLTLFGVIAVVSTIFRLDIARGYLAIALPLGLVALTANRWLWRRFVVRRRSTGEYMNAVLAVGRTDSIGALAQSMVRSPGDGYRLVGVCVPGYSRREMHIPTIGDVPAYDFDRDIAAAVADSGADTVVLTSGQLDPDEIRDFSWQLEKINVDLLVSPGMVDVAGPRLTVCQVGGQPLLHVDKPQYDGAKRFQKRAFDVCFATLVLLAASPLLLAAAVAVKLTSRGPVFYRQERIGLDGEPFRMIKFRSMVVDADKLLDDVASLNQGGGLLFKIRNDPRVTPVGRLLRRYSIDEVPQFFNVLRKDMSVVGPRPPLGTEVAAYDDHVRRRLLVRPGITGLWQVSGRSDLSWEESVRLDISYVENWSMLGDLAIAGKTAGAVLRASGAY
jgi:exopolysaccharide biosynthesis polyprenyl glycosylphosphotransferase